MGNNIFIRSEFQCFVRSGYVKRQVRSSVFRGILFYLQTLLCSGPMFSFFSVKVYYNSLIATLLDHKDDGKEDYLGSETCIEPSLVVLSTFICSKIAFLHMSTNIALLS